MRAVVNPARDAAAVPRPSEDAAAFHRGLPGYAPTPVHQLDRLAVELGVAAVRVKDESDRLGLPAFKILGASWAVERATLFAEAAEQATYDLILVPVGVGSLAAARHGVQVGAQVVGVEPVTAACLGASLVHGMPKRVPTPGTAMAGLDCAEVSPAAWPSLRRGIAGTVSVSDEEAATVVHELSAEGLAIGESGAAPLAGLRALQSDEECRGLREHVRADRQTRVLLIASEGTTARDVAD